VVVPAAVVVLVAVAVVMVVVLLDGRISEAPCRCRACRRLLFGLVDLPA
jgi:hypothetical protein